MATAGNAELMGWGEKTGRIAVGMEADLVFLRSDPVEDLRHVREVEIVVTDGRPHRADELLAVAQGFLER
jgi:imidazolonepropionase-like amidohydrolase